MVKQAVGSVSAQTIDKRKCPPPFALEPVKPRQNNMILYVFMNRSLGRPRLEQPSTSPSPT